MAQVALGVVGGVVGFMLGGPAGAAIGFGIGMAVTPDIPGPVLGEIARQTAKEGDPRLIVWGIVRPVGPNLIAVQDPPAIYKVSQGGKGGSGPRAEVPFRTYALGVCEGPITGYRRIWRNNKLVYDGRPGSVWGAYNNRVFLERATFYYGDYDQLPDPDLEAVFGVGEVPAHRGTAYIVIKNEDLQDTGGAVPQWLFEVVRDAGSLAPVVESSELLISANNNPGIGRLSVENLSYIDDDLPNPTGSWGADYLMGMQRIAISNQGSTKVIEYSVEDGTALRTLTAEVDSKHGNMWSSPTGRYIAMVPSTTTNQALYIIDVNTWSVVKPVTNGGLGSVFNYARWHPSEDRIAVCHTRLFGSASGRSILTTYSAANNWSPSDVVTLPIGATSGITRAVAWSPDGVQAYFSSVVDGESQLMISSTSSVWVYSEIHAYDHEVYSLDLSPDGQFLAIGRADGYIDIMRTDPENRVIVDTFLGSEQELPVLDIRYSIGGGYLAYRDQGYYFVSERVENEEYFNKVYSSSGINVRSISWSPF